MKACFESTATTEILLKENGSMINELIRVTRDTIVSEDILLANLEV
jgi:hypothetical protein